MTFREKRVQSFQSTETGALHSLQNASVEAKIIVIFHENLTVHSWGYLLSKNVFKKKSIFSTRLTGMAPY